MCVCAGMPQSSTHHSAPGETRHGGRNAPETAPPASRPNAKPLIRQRGPELQRYGTVTALPNGLDAKKSEEICENLNQLLADTMTLRDMYKKHHWQVVGPTFYQLHLLFDKHFEEQVGLVDALAERIQLLGGISI